MPVIRKVESKVKIVRKVSPTVKAEAESTPAQATDTRGVVAAPIKKKVCAFCANKTEPHYWDSQALRRFMSDRGRIVSRQRTGVCAKHQRRVATEIKRARHLAILPFVLGV